MTKFLSLDQSLSKCAWMVWEDGKIIDYGVWRTGSSSVKIKKKGVEYFDKTEEQIEYVCEQLLLLVESVCPDHIVLEALSFGSVGNATRDLAGLFFTLKYAVEVDEYCYLTYEDWTAYAPTSLKSFARDYLKEEDQTETSEKTGKSKKVKMDKKLMVKAARNCEGEGFLSEYNYSSGLDDLADAYWAGKKFIKERNL